MNAALLSQLRAASTIAQSRAGEAFTIGASSYTGVLNETSVENPGTATGYESIKALVIEATRTQFASKPDGVARTSITARGLVWTLMSVRETELHYVLTCVAT